MKSLYGLTKGTELEKTVAKFAQAEANGVMMYYALARLAKEQGMDDAEKIFIESANQEAVHAGFYSVLNGKYPQNFWAFAENIMNAEFSGKKSVSEFAEKVRALGFTDAANEMEIFAEQEYHHGEVIKKLFEKYKPEKSNNEGKKIYVCPVCGYEYVGDINSESNDWTCPLCGQPKSVFKEKN